MRSCYFGIWTGYSMGYLGYVGRTKSNYGWISGTGNMELGRVTSKSRPVARLFGADIGKNRHFLSVSILYCPNSSKSRLNGQPYPPISAFSHTSLAYSQLQESMPSVLAAIPSLFCLLPVAILKTNSIWRTLRPKHLRKKPNSH